MQILKNTEQIAHKNLAQNLLNRNSPPYFIPPSGTWAPNGGLRRAVCAGDYPELLNEGLNHSHLERFGPVTVLICGQQPGPCAQTRGSWGGGFNGSERRSQRQLRPLQRPREPWPVPGQGLVLGLLSVAQLRTDRAPIQRCRDRRTHNDCHKTRARLSGGGAGGFCRDLSAGLRAWPPMWCRSPGGAAPGESM